MAYPSYAWLCITMHVVFISWSMRPEANNLGAFHEKLTYVAHWCVQVNTALKNSGGTKTRREYTTRSHKDIGAEASASKVQGDGAVEKEEL